MAMNRPEQDLYFDFAAHLEQRKPDFDGATYERAHDKARLTGQCLRVFTAMSDGRWRTLAEIEAATGDPQASISARLRDLRKEKFGGYEVQRRARGERENGLFEYQLIVRT